MKRSQRKIRYLPRLMLAVVLFAQGVLAVHACVGPAAGAAQALSDRETVGEMHCHEPVKVNANECLMHCTQSDQVNLDRHAMPALPVSADFLQVTLPPVQHRVQVFEYSPLAVNTGPPLAIRFCSFLL